MMKSPYGEINKRMDSSKAQMCCLHYDLMQASRVLDQASDMTFHNCVAEPFHIAGLLGQSYLGKLLPTILKFW